MCLEIVFFFFHVSEDSFPDVALLSIHIEEPEIAGPKALFSGLAPAPLLHLTTVLPAAFPGWAE